MFSALCLFVFIPTLAHCFLAVGIIFILLVCYILYTAYTHKESALVAADQLKHDLDVEADDALDQADAEAEKVKEKVVTVVHTLDADVIEKLHTAESTEVLKPGTTQAYVDAHTQQVQAVSLVAMTNASTPTQP